jgi:hypothetical protein
MNIRFFLLLFLSRKILSRVYKALLLLDLLTRREVRLPEISSNRALVQATAGAAEVMEGPGLRPLEAGRTKLVSQFTRYLHDSWLIYFCRPILVCYPLAGVPGSMKPIAGVYIHRSFLTHPQTWLDVRPQTTRDKSN